MFRKMILAVSFVVAVAFSSQASAEVPVDAKTCDCYEHKVVEGDWISKITKEKLGIANDPDLFRLIATQSKLKTDQKFTIRPGQRLLIPKNYKSAKNIVFEASTEKAMLKANQVKLGFTPLSSPVLPVPTMTFESPKESIKVDQPIETVRLGHDTVKIVVDVPRSKPVTIVREGLYKIIVNEETLAGVKVGLFPALVISNVDDQGRWERKETVADIKEAGGGNFELIIPVNKTMRVSENSLVVFDLGGGSATVVSSEDLVGADSITHGKMKLVPLKKVEYAKLHEGFPSRPNFGKKAGKAFVKVGIPSAIGFLTSGPAGAVAPFGYAVFDHFREKSQRKAARKLAE